MQSSLKPYIVRNIITHHLYITVKGNTLVSTMKETENIETMKTTKIEAGLYNVSINGSVKYHIENTPPYGWTLYSGMHDDCGEIIGMFEVKSEAIEAIKCQLSK